jgi:spore coat protein U-like protein
MAVTLLPCAVLFAATPAGAETLDDLKSLTLNVHGEINQHCAMASISSMDFGDLTRPNLRASTRVGFNCNVPFNLKIEAANGALTNTEYPHGQGPYAGSVPYTVDVAIPVRKPRSSEVEGRFFSRDLMAGRTISSDGGIALQGLGLTVALSPPADSAELLAGRYAETIVITVTPV